MLYTLLFYQIPVQRNGRIYEQKILLVGGFLFLRLYRLYPDLVSFAKADEVFKLTIQHERVEVSRDGVNKEEVLTFDVIKQTEGLNANTIAERIGKSVPL